ncbi:Ferredoxin-NADP reductase [Micromonospora pattaloongensis]|uniref:Ferredoxin-NADP reductase n=1 Tax=Micromonospora pattaloongensis TaxID=405436 RepID=A0A1H3RRR2_9ACTN|nr:PDR/VanB family oxidoreductase [Micromonospora pattaloongensis]SDZ28045.1 Ferredoxin-NADP reductase [Micromonospora pattaloongensis]
MTTSAVFDAPAPTARTSSDFEADVVVVDHRDEADGVVGLQLSLPDGAALPSWTPGAHIDVELPNGLTRQYSLCGDPSDSTRWRLGVLREIDGRGGSRWLADELTVGTTLRIRGPRNNFPLQPAVRYVFLAGGIGITPLLPMIRAAEAAGADWVLHYGGRTRASMAFLTELSEYGQRVRICPQDETGLLDLDAALGAPAADTLVYCCGPTGLLDAVAARCADWPSGALRVERFTAAPVVPDGAETGFEVVCERSGLTVTVTPEQSILRAVEDAGIDVLSSCTEGICGTCETTVLEGEPDHRDSLLTDDEKAAGDTMMICVSRCRGPRLVLDL